MSDVIATEMLDFLRARLAEDQALTAPELHAKMRIIRAWPDPFGYWTADQAEAATVMKDQIIRAMAEVYREHPEWREEWRVGA